LFYEVRALSISNRYDIVGKRRRKKCL